MKLEVKRREVMPVTGEWISRAEREKKETFEIILNSNASAHFSSSSR